MDIKEDEIKEIKKIGSLNGGEVKLITLKGGFHIGVGKKNKNSKKPDILAVGSHPALINYQIEKKHGIDYEQVMTKNETEAMPTVTEYSHNLKSSFKNILGMDIYAMKKSDSVQFKLTKHNFDICTVETSEDGEEIVVHDFNWEQSKVDKMSKNDLDVVCDNIIDSIYEYATQNNLKVKI